MLINNDLENGFDNEKWLDNGNDSIKKEFK